MNKEIEINNYYDVIVIGGGAAGIMAALSAKRHHPEYSVIIVDQTFALGRKILVSGAGRCNLTNKALDNDKWRDRYYTDTPQVLDNVFGEFGYNEIIKFFEELGVKTYEEAKNQTGKIFPITDSAKNIVNLLVDELQRLKISISLETSCNKVSKRNNLFDVEIEKGKKKSLLSSKYLIIAAGGKTYPALGSNGSGYVLAQSFGHSIQQPVPAAGPLTSNDRICHELQGVKVAVGAKVIIDKKIEKQGFDDLLFTQYGVSGSLIFNLSRPVSIRVNREERVPQIKLLIDFLPKFSNSELYEYFETLWKRKPGQLLGISLLGLLNQKVAVALCKKISVNPQKQVKDISNAEKNKLIEVIKGCEIVVTGTKGWNESEFTAGGVRVAELNSRSLQSKIVENLYFCGEIINVDGDVGGFNLSWAWASGAVAGKLK